jgi:hypothetical protein
LLVQVSSSRSVSFLTSPRNRAWPKPPQAAKDVTAAQEALIDIFERIENFFKRLENYTEVPPTDAMTDIIVKIMVEVLNILAIATKETKQGRTSEVTRWMQCLDSAHAWSEKYLKKLVGRTDIEDALKRLDKLTQDEVRMATAQLLKLTHGVDDKVKVVDNKVDGVSDTVKLVLDGAWCEIFVYQFRYERLYNQMERKQK